MTSGSSGRTVTSTPCSAPTSASIAASAFGSTSVGQRHLEHHRVEAVADEPRLEVGDVDRAGGEAGGDRVDDARVIDAVDGDDVRGRGGDAAVGFGERAQRERVEPEPLAGASELLAHEVEVGRLRRSTISIIVKRPPSTAICESVMFSEWPSSARVTSATMPGRSRPIAERASSVMGVS